MVVAAYFTFIALTARESWMPVVSWVRLLPLSALYLALGIWGFDYALCQEHSDAPEKLQNYHCDIPSLGGISLSPRI